MLKVYEDKTTDKDVYLKLVSENDGCIVLKAYTKEGRELFNGNVLYILPEGIIKLCSNLNLDVPIKRDLHGYPVVRKWNC